MVCRMKVLRCQAFQYQHHLHACAMENVTQALLYSIIFFGWLMVFTAASRFSFQVDMTQTVRAALGEKEMTVYSVVPY